MQEQEQKLIEENLRTENQSKSGANWFFWIAGLSLINSIIVRFRVGLLFIFGLGITQVVDAVAAELGGAGVAISFVINIIILGIFVLFGIFARKGHVWAFVVGMILYALDGTLFLLVGPDYLSIGFHVLALVFMAAGVRATMKLNALARSGSGAGASVFPEQETFKQDEQFRS